MTKRTAKKPAKKNIVSPLAPKSRPALPDVAGVQLASGNTGVKYKARPDLLLARLDKGTAIAGVLTISKTASAPVEACRANLKYGRARAIIVNAGNANAFTGRAGRAAVNAITANIAGALGVDKREIFTASTGVIGEPLDPGPINKMLDKLCKKSKPGSWETAARAIMTTDTYPKFATRTARIGGVRVTINAIAKGSGMIAPDMATMLGFIFTDARIPVKVLRSLLRASVKKSFNAITVDGDTSTSDTVLLVATGKARHRAVNAASAGALDDFRKKLDSLTLELAHMIVKDGEGAEKFVTITVKAAASEKAARTIAMSIANSPLVKTAIAGGDPNWGRIVMAVGKAGEAANRDRLAIWIGKTRVAKNGRADPAYKEPPVARYMKGREIAITVNVGVGKAQATVWSCDLTHRYIDINADYRS